MVPKMVTMTPKKRNHRTKNTKTFQNVTTWSYCPRPKIQMTLLVLRHPSQRFSLQRDSAQEVDHGVGLAALVGTQLRRLARTRSRTSLRHGSRARTSKQCWRQAEWRRHFRRRIVGCGRVGQCRRNGLDPTRDDLDQQQAACGSDSLLSD